MEKYQSAMILSAVGDAMGYKNWDWKHNQSGAKIMKELQELGGIDSLWLYPSTWPVSDETIMHMATARALVARGKAKKKEHLYDVMAENYVESNQAASRRRPDPAYEEGCSHLRPGQIFGWHIPFNPRGTGFGAATKAMCIGLLYCKTNQDQDLISIATECGRMTHNHPLGFTGSVCTALFTSYILQSKPITCWGRDMLSSLDKVKSHCKKLIRNNEEYRPHWIYFEAKWEDYLRARGIANAGEDTPKIPDHYDVEARDKTYRSWSSEGQPGRRGHDAPMIAYDALLVAHQSKSGNLWENVCNHAMMHGGECDATGAIAGFWYGLMYGMEGIPPGHHEKVEFRDELEELGAKLYEMSN